MAARRRLTPPRWAVLLEALAVSIAGGAVLTSLAALALTSTGLVSAH